MTAGGVKIESMVRVEETIRSCPQPQDPEGRYWDAVVEWWEPTLTHRLWRAHSDAVNRRLLARWLAPDSGRLLKTDLFDEAVARGLYPELAARSREVVGIDLSPGVVRSASQRYPSLDARLGNVLALPFPNGSFDVVVSNSTLDHFDSHEKLQVAIAELARLIRPAGKLIITLDNRMNPVVALRTSKLLFGTLHRVGVVPYFVGATYGHRCLTKVLCAAGFNVEDVTTIMHCPPQLAAWWAGRRGAGARGGDVKELTHVRRVLQFEAMERWPTRHLTGHFVAALATRR
jgi:SAM-dependent methyltransferase